MPYRCTNCQHLSKSDDNPDCKTRMKCNFERVAVIHFAGPDGQGRVVGSGSRTVEDAEKSVSVRADVKLYCSSEVPGAAFTEARFAATCLTCLENSPQPEPEPEPEQPAE